MRKSVGFVFFSVALALSFSAAWIAAAGSAAPQAAELWVKKRLVTSGPTPGISAMYELNFANQGAVGANAVWLTDTLPLSMTFSSLLGGEICAPACYEFIPASQILQSGQVAWSLGELPAGAHGSLILMAEIDPNLPPGSLVTNTLQISPAEGESNLLDNRYAISATIKVPLPDLGVKIHLEPPGLVPTTIATLVGYWSNSGSATAPGAVFTVTLPEELSYAGFSQSSFTPILDKDFLPAPQVDGQVVRWQAGDLQSGWFGFIYIYVNVAMDSAPGKQVISRIEASLPPGDPTPANNAFQLESTIQEAFPDLTIQKTLESVNGNPWPRLAPGVTARYRISWHNRGTTRSAAAWITDTLPLHTSYITSQGWAYTPTYTPTLPAQPAGEGQYTWELGELEPGWSGALVITLTVDTDAPLGEPLTNTARISIVPNELDSLNNLDIDVHLVEADAPDMYVYQYSFTPDYFPGGIFQNTLQFSNRGSQTAASVIVTNLLPEGAIYIRSGGSYYLQGFSGPSPLPAPEVDGRRLTWQLGDLPPGSFGYISLTDQLSQSAAPGSSLENVLSIPPVAGEVVVYNNSLTTSAQVQTNHAPIAQDQFLQIEEDTPVTITLSITDPDGDSNLHTWVYQFPQHGALSGLPPYQYIPAVNYAGTDRIIFRAADPSTAIDEAIVDLNILPVDDPPRLLNSSVANPQRQVVPLGTDFFLGHYVDPDGPPLLSVRFESLPQHGKLLLDGRTLPAGLDLPLDRLEGLIYLPSPGYSGDDGFTWSGANGLVRSGPAWIRIFLLEQPFQAFFPLAR